MNKSKLLKFNTALFILLFIAAAVIVLYAVSPLHPKNISDEAVIKKGDEYSVRVGGVSDYNENGLELVTESFYFSSKKANVYKDENGFACTSFDAEGENYVLGEYNSPFISYDAYSFCGEKYKNSGELTDFFDEPDRIYNFDINNLGIYIQDIIQYKKHFYGRATVRLYRGRLVITELYIGDEKVLEIKKENY